MFLGKLALQLDKMREGITYLEKAKKILSVSHGEDHELVHILRSTLAEASREMLERENYNIIKRIYNDE